MHLRTLRLEAGPTTTLSPDFLSLLLLLYSINKIVYYQHLLVSFEEFLSLRLSAGSFRIVVGRINNN